MRGERLARQWKILQMLLSSREGLSAAELAARPGYSVRSVYREKSPPPPAINPRLVPLIK